MCACDARGRGLWSRPPACTPSPYLPGRRWTDQGSTRGRGAVDRCVGRPQAAHDGGCPQPRWTTLRGRPFARVTPQIRTGACGTRRAHLHEASQCWRCPRPGPPPGPGSPRCPERHAAVRLGLGTDGRGPALGRSTEQWGQGCRGRAGALGKGLEPAGGGRAGGRPRVSTVMVPPPDSPEPPWPSPEAGFLLHPGNLVTLASLPAPPRVGSERSPPGVLTCACYARGPWGSWSRPAGHGVRGPGLCARAPGSTSATDSATHSSSPVPRVP